MWEEPTSDENSLYVMRFGRNRHTYEFDDVMSDLVAELRRAYMVKGLQAQLEERCAHNYSEQVRERASAEQARRQEQQEALEEERQRREEIRRKHEEYRRQLDLQLKQKEEEKRLLLEEAEKYRKFLEEADRAQEEEELSRALEKKCELTKKTRREQLIFEEMREIREQMEREADEKKQQQDQEYLMMMEERSKKISSLRSEQAHRRERLLQETMRMIVDAEIRKRHREEQLIELVAEEIRFELMIREMEETMRRKKMQRELATTLREQIVFTEQCKQRYLEEDRAWAEQIMTKIMESEKVTRSTEAAKRRLKLHYREDLENLIEHRRKIREKEIAKIEEGYKEEQRLRISKRERAKEERKRLLKQHAAKIANFVNKAVLTSEEQEIIEAELSKKAEDAENVDENCKDVGDKDIDDEDIEMTIKKTED